MILLGGFMQHLQLITHTIVDGGTLDGHHHHSEDPDHGVPPSDGDGNDGGHSDVEVNCACGVCSSSSFRRCRRCLRRRLHRCLRPRRLCLLCPPKMVFEKPVVRNFSSNNLDDNGALLLTMTPEIAVGRITLYQVIDQLHVVQLIGIHFGNHLLQVVVVKIKFVL
jgi:hypothetical protein